MTTGFVEKDITLQQNKDSYSEQIGKIIELIIPRFDKTIKSYVIFNMLFLFIGIIEFFLLAIFFSFLAQSSYLAFSLAIAFLTLFSYFTLRIYFQTKHPEQLLELREEYLNTCKRFINYQEGIAEHHMALANASCKLATTIHGHEYNYYKPPSWIDILAPTAEKFSCWWHWYDLHKMKELLLLCSVDEHIKLVKNEPTNLEVHAALANAYVMLSTLYADPKKAEGYDEDLWTPSQRFSEEMHRRFRATAECAIEEFKILNDYAPNDPWIHIQLAYSYHDLQMPQEEIREYETILKLNPDDKDTLFKLGMLYFRQGLNAKGLSIYEELKRSHYKKAENLIKFYGAYSL